MNPSFEHFSTADVLGREAARETLGDDLDYCRRHNRRWRIRRATAAEIAEQRACGEDPQQGQFVLVVCSPSWRFRMRRYVSKDLAKLGLFAAGQSAAELSKAGTDREFLIHCGLCVL